MPFAIPIVEGLLSLVLGGLAAAAVNASLNLGMGLAHPARAVQASAFVLGLIGVWTTNPRVRDGLVGVMTVLILLSAFSQLAPDWLA